MTSQPLIDLSQLSTAELRRRLADAGIALRTPPDEPTTCCGRGCNGCVWESFYLAEDWWKEQAARALAAATAPPARG